MERSPGPRQWHGACNGEGVETTSLSSTRRYIMRSPLITVGTITLAFLVLVCAGCKNDSSNPYGPPATSSTAPAGNSANNVVVMSGMTFNPAQITVKVGTTVTWTNNDGYAHTSTSDSGLWDTDVIAAGHSASHQFTTAGIYPYHCTYHVAMGMKGTVVVQ